MTLIDLSLLPAPDVVEPLDFEAVYQDMLAAFRTLMGDGWSAALESDPVVKLLELAAYREVQIRARINDAARSVMLAYAVGSDLDQIGADFGVVRLDGEEDARFRYRIQQGFHRLAAAGPINAYRQHALAVSTDIADVDVWSEAPGQVTVAVLAKALYPVSEVAEAEVIAGEALFGPGPDATHAYVVAPADSTLLRNVLAALNADDVRPLTDAVVVRAPVVRTFTVTAVIEVLPGPDPELILQRREAALRRYVASVGNLSFDATRAGIIAALVEAGVKNVQFSEPVSDIVCGRGEIAVMTSLQLSAEIVDA